MRAALRHVISGHGYFPAAVSSEVLRRMEGDVLVLLGWQDAQSLMPESFPSDSSEDRVIEYYKKLNGQTRGQAIVK